MQSAEARGPAAAGEEARQQFHGGAAAASAGQASASPAWRLSAALEAERHRWFLWVPVLLGAGIGLYFALPAEPGLPAALAPVPAAVILAVALRRGTLPYAAARILLVVAVGFAVAKFRTEWVRAPVIERPVTVAEVRGYVELIEPQLGRGQRLTVLVSAIEGLAPEATPRRVRIRSMRAGAALKPGDAVVFAARLSAPADPVLPGGYDFGRRAWYLGIGGVGFALKEPRIDAGAGPLPGLLRLGTSIERVRVAIGAAIVAALPGETGAIANALLTGERGGISAETDKSYRDSGLYHVLSISGLHMTVMAGTLFLAVRLLLAAIPGVALRFPVKIWAALIAAIGALGYLLISGGAFATLRSYVMISIIFLALVAERPALAMRNIALAALAMLLVWPESLLDPGFQMSFAAVAALIAALEAWQAREQRLGRTAQEPRGPLIRTIVFLSGIVVSTLIAGAAVAPLAAYHFHTSQQYSVLGNVLALPVCDLVVMPALLAALVMIPLGLEAYPLAIAGIGIDAMTLIAGHVGRLPGAVAAIPAIPLSALLAFVAGGLWLMLWTGRWRIAGLAGVALGLALAPMLDRPDVLIGRGGSLLAARIDSGRLSAAPGSRGDFELSRWLEADGDGRSAAEAAAGRGFDCDAIGCTATVRGSRLALMRHRAGASEDCARARLLVTPAGRPRGCMGPARIIDGKALREGGVHAVYITPAAIRVETVADARGRRPWARPPPGARAGGAGPSSASAVAPGIPDPARGATAPDDDERDANPAAVDGAQQGDLNSGG